MIIDTHTHLFSDEVRGNRQDFCRRDEGFQLIYGNNKARLAGCEDLLQAMNQNGVEQSVICGFPWGDPGLCQAGNDYLFHCSRQHPGRMIPFLSLPWHSFRLGQKELERCLSLGMQGVGELAFYRRGISQQDSRRLSSLLAPLSGRGIPLLLHANEPVGHDYPGKSPEGLRPLYPLLLSLPDLTIILAHWGGGFFFYELMPEVARAARNVFYDTAASPFLYHPQIYDIAARIIGPKRILFGSDYPLISPARYFEELKRSRLPAHVQARIKGLNAKQLFFGGAISGNGPGKDV